MNTFPLDRPADRVAQMPRPAWPVRTIQPLSICVTQASGTAERGRG
ncbi:hypothetical protein [Streptomyces zagrosensis]|uniref:Uncharacterized protein n=1 Tax=Streptomyces zagrosensis TaxID=1042984 RepID=A0A7W9QAS0_9ACTN|nr:hypothetical protein [Streptomyces zagrosensis]MBB5936803.1 hypothetical protein [Streptomyces zagrosensis]